MSYPIKEILEIKSGVSKEDALTALKKDVEELSKTDPKTVYIKYFIITDTGDYVGMVSDNSKKIMGIKDNIIIDKPLKNILIEEIPSTFLKDYQFVIPTDSTMTDDEIQTAAQDKASELLNKSTNTIPVIRIINLKNEENNVTVPAVFGNDFINTDEEQISDTEGKIEDLTEEDVDTLMKRFQIQLKNQNLLSEDADALLNQVKIAAKKTSTVVQTAKATQNEIYKKLKDSGLTDEQAKKAAESVSKKIKDNGDLNNLSTIVTEALTNSVPVNVPDPSKFNEAISNIKNFASMVSKNITIPKVNKDGKVDIDQSKALSELKGNNIKFNDISKLSDFIGLIGNKVMAIMGLNTIGLTGEQLNKLGDIIKNSFFNQDPNEVVIGKVYNFLIDQGFKPEQIINLITDLMVEFSEKDLFANKDVIYKINDNAKNDIAKQVNLNKMGYDLFNYASTKYDLDLFKNLKNSYKLYMDKSNELAQKYQALDTDVVSMDAGKFSDNDVEALYNTLKSEIDSSLTDALKVGVKANIENVNTVEDLLSQVKDINPQDIVSLFTNIMNGNFAQYWSFDKVLKDNNVTNGVCSIGRDYCKTPEEYPMPFGTKPSIPEDVENADSTGEVVDS